MVDHIFLFKLLISFIIGSLWITGSTILAEKLGPKVGGVIAGMPSTIVIGLFFIGWTQTPFIAAQSAVIVPIAQGISALYVLIYVYLVRRNFLLSILVSLCMWFVLAVGLVFFKFNNFALSLLGYALLLCISYLLMQYVLHIKSIRGQNYHFSISNVIFRAMLSGTIIVLTVTFARLGGPLVGGAFASFPAVFTSTMIISYRSQSSAFSSGVMKILMLSGTTNVTVYATAIKFLYPLFGLIGGTLSSFLISLVSTYLIFLLVKKIG